MSGETTSRRRSSKAGRPATSRVRVKVAIRGIEINGRRIPDIVADIREAFPPDEVLRKVDLLMGFIHGKVSIEALRAELGESSSPPIARLSTTSSPKTPASRARTSSRSGKRSAT